MLSLKGSGPAVFVSGLDGCSFQLAWILPEGSLAPQTYSSLPPYEETVQFFPGSLGQWSF